MNQATDRRKADLAKIHIAKKQLGLDDETYRAMLWTVARVKSSADLDEYGRQRVIEHLRRAGFKTEKPAGRAFPGRPHNCDDHPQLRKIEALLTSSRRPWSYVDAMAHRMFGKDRIAFCNQDEWQRVIAALTIDKQRHQVTHEQ
jgi:phage gp16-like protein